MRDATDALKAQLGILTATFKAARQNHAKDLAATIAFWTFFSIFPLLIGTLSLAGYFLEGSQLTSRIYDLLSDLLPGSGSLVMVRRPR